MKKVFAILLTLFVCIGLTACTSSSNSSTVSQSNKSNYEEPTIYSENTENEPLYDNDDNSVASTGSNATMGESNALASAKQYLSIMAFSYSGLIEQLEYEGYSNSEATYAADNCGADWYEQAALSAKEYLNIMSFSKQGLIEQLEYDGFTYDQAVYGAEQCGY